MNLEQAVEKLKELLLSADRKARVSISGELGAGKTHLVQKLAKSLEPEATGRATSPTYTYCNQYRLAGREVHHYDLYRVRDASLLESIGLWESLEGTPQMVLVEWAELFPEILTSMDYQLTITVGTDGTRGYKLEETLREKSLT